MLHFDSDYMEGAHPLILERLHQINLEQNTGYGLDEWCASAKNRIRESCECPDADVHFLVGGTQANKTVIASILRTYQGVIAVDSGHIAVHEAGAVEMTGHKVLTIPGKMGKLDAADEDPLLCARRELEEETGLNADNWQLLSRVVTTPGFCTERISIYLATGLSQHKAHTDPDEFVRVKKMPFADAVQEVLQGKLYDQKTALGILLAKAALENKD